MAAASPWNDPRRGGDAACGVPAARNSGRLLSRLVVMTGIFRGG
jgi:hypothetical protein